MHFSRSIFASLISSFLSIALVCSGSIVIAVPATQNKEDSSALSPQSKYERGKEAAADTGTADEDVNLGAFGLQLHQQQVTLRLQPTMHLHLVIELAMLELNMILKKGLRLKLRYLGPTFESRMKEIDATLKSQGDVGIMVGESALMLWSNDTKRYELDWIKDIEVMVLGEDKTSYQLDPRTGIAYFFLSEDGNWWQDRTGRSLQYTLDIDDENKPPPGLYFMSPDLTLHMLSRLVYDTIRANPDIGEMRITNIGELDKNFAEAVEYFRPMLRDTMAPEIGIAVRNIPVLCAVDETADPGLVGEQALVLPGNDLVENPRRVTRIELGMPGEGRPLGPEEAIVSVKSRKAVAQLLRNAEKIGPGKSAIFAHPDKLLLEIVAAIKGKEQWGEDHIAIRLCEAMQASQPSKEREVLEMDLVLALWRQGVFGLRIESAQRVVKRFTESIETTGWPTAILQHKTVNEYIRAHLPRELLNNPKAISRYRVYNNVDETFVAFSVGDLDIPLLRKSLQDNTPANAFIQKKLGWRKDELSGYPEEFFARIFNEVLNRRDFSKNVDGSSFKIQLPSYAQDLLERYGQDEYSLNEEHLWQMNGALLQAIYPKETRSRISFGASAPFIPIDGLFRYTGQFAHIGLGQAYGRPVVYMDTDYFVGIKSGGGTIRRHELYEIAKWDQFRTGHLAKRLGKVLSWPEMRNWILSNVKEARSLAERWHNQAPSLQPLVNRLHHGRPPRESLPVADPINEDEDVLISASAIPIRPGKRPPEEMADLTLNNGVVERPSTYQWDAKFWKRIEKANPGVTERVKRLLALYSDSLVEGVDYDKKVGRSFRIRLEHPVKLGGVLMHELIVKGAAFAKHEEAKAYPLYDGAAQLPEQWAQLKRRLGPIYFDEEGQGHLGQTPGLYERFDSMEFEQARTDYEMGREVFLQNTELGRYFPVMLARFIKETGFSGDNLGAVVIASPWKDQEEMRTDQYLNQLLRLADIGVITPSSVTRLINRHFRAMGRALRRFHDAGYIHGNPHPGNIVTSSTVFWDHEDMTRFWVDYEDAKIKTSMPAKQAFAYQVLDIARATNYFYWMMQQYPHPQLVKQYLEQMRHFLSGYFGGKTGELIFIATDEQLMQIAVQCWAAVDDLTPLNHGREFLINSIARVFVQSWGKSNIISSDRPSLNNEIGQQQLIGTYS